MAYNRSFDNIKTTNEGTGEARLKIIGPEYSDNIAWDDGNSRLVNCVTTRRIKWNIL